MVKGSLKPLKLQMTIVMLTATLDMEKLPAGPEVSLTFIIRLWYGHGVLRGVMQGLCLDVGEAPHVGFTGAGVVGLAVADVDHRTMTCE